MDVRDALKTIKAAAEQNPVWLEKMMTEEWGDAVNKADHSEMIQKIVKSCSPALKGDADQDLVALGGEIAAEINKGR